MSISMLVFNLQEIEDLLAGKTITRTYHHWMLEDKFFGTDHTQMWPVAIQDKNIWGEHYTDHCYVDVTVEKHKIEQRGKGQKRPQYNHIYTFRAVGYPEVN